MKALLVDNRGEKPSMVMGEQPTPSPGPGELLVKVKATALNRADLLQKSGNYPPPAGESPILGLDMAGVVEQVGSDVTRFRPGDPVFGLLPGGGYAEYCTIPEELSLPIPRGWSFEEAAALPEVFLTAWQALVWLGQIGEGETVLIHAGASGVGTAAIQLASRLFGCRVITTAGSEEKLEVCRNLGADLAINYREEEFSERIRSETGPESVDLIIDFIGAPYWEKNLNSLSQDGRLIILAMMGGAVGDRLRLGPLLRKRLTVRGSTLRNRDARYKKRLVADFWDRTEELFLKRELLPVIDSVYDWNDVEAAHRKMEENRNIGKIILNGM